MASDLDRSSCSPLERREAWAVHLFTASGLVVGMLGLQAVLVDNARMAMIWLLVTQVIDGVDGPIARALHVEDRLPKIDGYVLDLVIDFVTCVIVPVVFLYEFNVLGDGPVPLLVCGWIVLTSAIWFSRTDMMTEDHWFRGFPAVWNVVAPTLYLLDVRGTTAGIIVVVLALGSLTDFPVPHPVRVVKWRPVTLSVTVIWLLGMTLDVLWLPERPGPEAALLVLGPAYFFVIGVVHWAMQRQARTASAS
ncbi:MAG: CDP-alcohol phosphatidyltransferase family protein [Acidimicrobiia bacterium]